MTPVFLRSAAYVLALGLLSVLLFWLGRRGSRRMALDAQREIAHRAGLDTYTPQSQDREWSQWARHHGGGL